MKKSITLISGLISFIVMNTPLHASSVNYTAEGNNGVGISRGGDGSFSVQFTWDTLTGAVTSVLTNTFTDTFGTHTIPTNNFSFQQESFHSGKANVFSLSYDGTFDPLIDIENDMLIQMYFNPLGVTYPTIIQLSGNTMFGFYARTIIGATTWDPGSLSPFVSDIYYPQQITITADGANVPEPTTIMLFAAGVIGFAAYRKRATQVQNLI